MKLKKIIALAAAAVLICGVFAGCSKSKSSVTTASDLSQTIESKPGTVIGVWVIDAFINKDGKTQSIEDFVAATLNMQYGVVIDRESDDFVRAMEMYKSITLAFSSEGKMTSVVLSGNDAGQVSGTYTVENGEVTIRLTSGKTGSYQYDKETDTLSSTSEGVTTVFKRRVENQGQSQVESQNEPQVSSDVPSEAAPQVESQTE